MLIHSEAYAQYNLMQIRDSTTIMKEYANVLNWTDYENVLDVGCGPGDVTVNLILPLMSSKSQLVKKYSNLVTNNWCNKLLSYIIS